MSGLTTREQGIRKSSRHRFGLEFTVKASVIGAIGVIILVGLLIGFGIGVTNSTVDAGGGMDADVASLYDALEATDAVVMIDDVTLGDVLTAESGAQYQVALVDISDVLYLAKVPSQSMLGDYPADLELATGPLTIYEPLGSEALRNGADPISKLRQVTGTPTVALLGFWSPELYPDWPANWGVIVLATEAKDQSLAFVGDDAGRYREDLALASSELTDASQLEALVAWLAEKENVRSGGPRGPMDLAYVTARRAASAQDWYDLDPANRPLDPELTPADVFAALVETPTMILVEDGAVRKDAYVAILTEQGVAHVAHLSGGSHPAPVFSRAEDDWEIVIADDPAELGKGRIVETIARAERASKDAVVITVSALASDPSNDDIDVSATAVTAEEFTSVTDLWLSQAG